MSRRLRSPKRRHLCRVHLVVLLALLGVVGLALVASADELAEMVAYSRDDAANPSSSPFLGPPPGSLYAPSEAIFPAQDLPLRFFHDKHIIDAEMGCVDCHEQALTSTKAADRLLPQMELCLNCHSLEDASENFPREEDSAPPADCTTCHPTYVGAPPVFAADVEEIDEDNFMEVTNPPPAVFIPTPNIKFPHKDHVDADIACATCHGTLQDTQLATRMNLPSMALCLTCHTSANDTPADKCGTCHMTEPDGRLKTRFVAPNFATETTLELKSPAASIALRNLTHVDPMLLNPPSMKQNEGSNEILTLMPAGRFKGDDHRLDYLEQHRHVSAPDAQYCQSCHTETYCLDCHNGVAKPTTVHPPGYSQLHAIDAYNDQPTCSSCHNRQDFCLTCHQQTGLTIGEVGAANKTYHPANWTLPYGGQNGLNSGHAVAAQRNVGTCASCHNEQLCIGCHSTQSDRQLVPVNPHPDGWTDRCASLMTRNSTSCLKCHVPNDPLLLLCQ